MIFDLIKGLLSAETHRHKWAHGTITHKVNDWLEPGVKYTYVARCLKCGKQKWREHNTGWVDGWHPVWEKAGKLLSILPVAVLFLVLQREFLSGLTAGAVKG